MRILYNIFNQIQDLINCQVIFASLAIAPVLGWLANFVLGEWEFVLSALLGVAFSVVIAVYAAIRTKSNVWNIIEVGVVKAFVYVFMLILTHKFAHHKVSPAVDMITEHIDWLLYAVIMMVELRQIKISASMLGVNIPELPFKKLNDLLKNDGNKDQHPSV